MVLLSGYSPVGFAVRLCCGIAGQHEPSRQNGFNSRGGKMKYLIEYRRDHGATVWHEQYSVQMQSPKDAADYDRKIVGGLNFNAGWIKYRLRKATP
jgi:hypothetical protein